MIPSRALHSYASFSVIEPYFTFSFTVVRAIVSITTQFLSLFKFGLKHSLVHIFGWRFGCPQFTFLVRVLVPLIRFSVSLSLIRRMLFFPIFLCSHYHCGFIYSIFALTAFGRFCSRRFVFTVFALTFYKRYVFLSLKCSIICMTSFCMLLSQILVFKNFRTEKLQMVITFDRKLGLRHSKNKSCSKWRNEACGQFQRGFGHKFFSKILSFNISFLFVQYFVHLFLYFTYLYLSKNFGNCCGISLYGLEIYQRILENFRIFFFNIEILHRLWASNRRNRVDTISVESHNRRSISS